ncbi:hypothetical protein IC582_005264 [Cucumis melo]
MYFFISFITFENKPKINSTTVIYIFFFILVWAKNFSSIFFFCFFKDNGNGCYVGCNHKLHPISADSDRG